MTFGAFEAIVKQTYPKAVLYKHGEFAGNKINVAVVFDEYSKVYQYNGTYVEVLNKLKIRACYKHDVQTIEKAIERLKKTNGTDGFFGEIMDNTDDIAKYEAMLKDLLDNCIIC